MTSDFDPLWVPLLTHYDPAAERLDAARAAAHIRSITPHVRQYLVAGTTGDGWGMKEAVFEDWLAFCAADESLSEAHSVLIGAFGNTTDEVVEQARRIEAALAKSPMRARFAGLTVCSPVGEGVTQEAIRRHFEGILAATKSPLAIYQLPQVTGNIIEPETFLALAMQHPRITLFKDTSGGDAITGAKAVPESVSALRGMEGSYARHIKPSGRYDGWLLSTANGFAPQLRQIAEWTAAGRQDEANELSEKLSKLVDTLFARAGGLPSGNPFSNANRAVDHIRAYGDSWSSHNAVLADGSALPESFVAQTASLLDEAGWGTKQGYLKE